MFGYIVILAIGFGFMAGLVLVARGDQRHGRYGR